MMTWALFGASTIAAEYMIPALRAARQEIAHVVSSDASRAKEFAGRHSIPMAGADLGSALDDAGVGAVYVSSANPHHLPQAMAAIAAGKHVLCEKPLAMNLADARAMVAAAEREGVTLATNHHLRCSGSHRAVRDLIRAGAVGQVLSLRLFHAVQLPPHLQHWRITTAGQGGGVIPDITVHDADVAMFLLDEVPDSVVAMAGKSGLGQDVEDSAMSVWSMPSGAMVQSHESFTHPFAGSGLQVHGTLGSIFADGVMTQRPVGRVTVVTAAGSRDVPFPTHDLYTQGVTEFVAACEGRGRPAATGGDGVRSLAVAMAVRQAAQTGQRVKVAA